MNALTGGTLGLFTGISIISLVEFAFWVFRVAKAMALKGPGRNVKVKDGPVSPEPVEVEDMA